MERRVGKQLLRRCGRERLIDRQLLRWNRMERQVDKQLLRRCGRERLIAKQLLRWSKQR
jgi:hypothetical protein